MVATRADFWPATTARARRFKSPLREFLRTDGAGARVGERRRLFLRAALGGRARNRPRRQPDRADAARVGEQRADDALLLRAGSGGPARVRPRRPSRAPAVRAPV